MIWMNHVTLKKSTTPKTNMEMHQPVHLTGHGISGTVAYQYAQKYPRNISYFYCYPVDANSSNQWTNYYQSMRDQTPCTRQHILSHLSSLLIDSHSEQIQEIMSKMLANA